MLAEILWQCILSPRAEGAPLVNDPRINPMESGWDAYKRNGWASFKRRETFEYRSRVIMDGAPMAAIPVPMLVDMRAKRVFIVSEQGLGDELFFLRFARLLKAWAGAESVTMAVDSRLRPLLRESELMFVDKGGHVPPHDVKALAGDLPLILGCDGVSNIPPPVRIYHDFERADQFMHLPRPWIGIQWRSGSMEHNRSGAGISKNVGFGHMRQEIIEGFSGTVFAMQRDSTVAEDMEMSKRGNVVNVCNWSQDVENAAALLSVLDFYVAPSNTNIHILAGLEKRPLVCVMVPFPPVDWRWMQPEGGPSPWFPEFTVQRQKPDLSW